MSATTEARTLSLDVLLTLCCECGTTRTVNRRAAGHYGDRALRCETCRTTTKHAAIGANSGDWREKENGRSKLTLSVADKLDVLEALGVRIEYQDTFTDTLGSRAIVSVWWWFDNDDGADDFLVSVSRDSTDDERDKRLTRALEHVTKPREHSWFIDARDGGTAANVCFAAPKAR